MSQWRRRAPSQVAVLVMVSIMAVSSQLAVAPSAGAAGTSPTNWLPYLLGSPDQFRLTAPPAQDSDQTQRELRTLRRLQRDRTAKMKRKIHFWNDDFGTRRWTELALDMITKQKQRPPFAARIVGLLHAGMYDAMIAAYDSKEAYVRTSPWKAEDRIEPLITYKGSSYPPVNAAIAGAAESILTALFPNEPPRTFEEMADEAIATRLWAGANYPSDVNRGRVLGNEVATLFLARASSDGATTNTTPPYPRPAGEQYWEPTPPGFEAPIGGPVGTWDPWLMSSPDQARNDSALPPPFAYGSPELMDELQEVMDVQENLTAEQRSIAQFWDDSGGTYTPAGHWMDIALDLAKSHDMNTKEAARTFALLGVVEADGAIAFFEAKYFWWSIRPVSVVRRLCDNATKLCTKDEIAADPTRATFPTWLPYLLTPAFPAYPGGHSTFSGSAGKTLEYFFPDAAGLINEQAEEAAMSRLYGGIHFRSDNDAGLVLGRQIAEYAITRAEADGSGL